MTRREECKEHILAIWKISTLAKICMSYSQYMHSPLSDIEKVYLNNSYEFKFIRHILWRNTVIELAKIFNSSKKRDRYNLFHFINKLNPNQYYGGLGVSDTKLNQWVLELETNRETIDKILDLRDKVYGHTDTERIRKELDVPSFKEVENLFLIIENVIQEIYATIFNGHPDTELTFVKRNLTRIIRPLAEHQKKSIEEITRSTKESK